MGETTVGHVAGEVVRALYGAGYMESTIGQYRKSIRALERYAGGPDAVYTRGLGAGFAASTFSGRTGGFSRQRWFDYGRQAGAFVRLVSAVRFGGPGQVAQEQACGAGGSGFGRGHGALGGVSRRFGTGFGDGGALPSDGGLVPHVAGIWGVVSLDGSDGSHVLGFLAGLRSRWSESSMRHAASDLRPLFRWLGRDDLADAIGLAGIRRTHAIAGMLPDDEHRRLLEACASRSVPSRDAAITLLSLTCGLRGMRCDRSEDRRRGLGFHEHRSGAAKDGQSVDRADDGTAGREAGVLAVGRKARHRRRPCVRAVQGAPCRASGSFIGVRGDQPCHAARRARTPGRFQAVAAQRGATRREDAGGGHAGHADQRRSARCLATPTPIPHASTWPRTGGECSRACCPCRKADRHETHGTRISSARSPANWRSTSASRRPWAGMAPPASGSCARSTGIASNTRPCVWRRASGAGRRGAMDRP
ncbi:hypothetical protein K10-5_00127 [Bifidobacterium longum]|nr:hypothetical protein K10-5_00127 [Bifidobacterium longum]